MGSIHIDRIGRIRSALGLVLGLICLFSCPPVFAAPADIGGLTVTLPAGGRRARAISLCCRRIFRKRMTTSAAVP